MYSSPFARLINKEQSGFKGAVKELTDLSLLQRLLGVYEEGDAAQIHNNSNKITILPFDSTDLPFF